MVMNYRVLEQVNVEENYFIKI